uniref:Uncharacterized protein n=1 Tax=Setaria italica TaxID=4555 RepID=K3YFP4_SETIT
MSISHKIMITFSSASRSLSSSSLSISLFCHACNLHR